MHFLEYSSRLSINFCGGSRYAVGRDRAPKEVQIFFFSLAENCVIRLSVSFRGVRPSCSCRAVQEKGDVVP